MKKEDCIFCKIASGDIPSNTIYENSEFKVIMDIAPASKGHVLIIPKEHFKDIYEIDAITAGKLFQLATVVARALKEVLHCDGLNVLQNNGLITYAVIPDSDSDGTDALIYSGSFKSVSELEEGYVTFAGEGRKEATYTKGDYNAAE